MSMSEFVKLLFLIAFFSLLTRKKHLMHTVNTLNGLTFKCKIFHRNVDCFFFEIHFCILPPTDDVYMNLHCSPIINCSKYLNKMTPCIDKTSEKASPPISYISYFYLLLVRKIKISTLNEQNSEKNAPQKRSIKLGVKKVPTNNQASAYEHPK